MKWKVFFIIFKELSLKQIKQSFSEGESSTLNEFKILTENYFSVHHKNKRKHNQHLPLLFFMLNLHSGTSNYLHVEKQIRSWWKVRSNRRRCSVRKGVLRNFAKLTGKHLCQSLFLDKVAKEDLAQLFSCEFYEISKKTFITKHL